jgi:hypothetical protein
MLDPHSHGMYSQKSSAAALAHPISSSTSFSFRLLDTAAPTISAKVTLCIGTELPPCADGQRRAAVPTITCHMPTPPMSPAPRYPPGKPPPPPESRLS